MKDAGNIAQVLKLEPDYMGFIFYKKSPRYVGDDWAGPGKDFPDSTKKVGVFVNEPLQKIRALASRFQFDYLQLHGDETPQYCKELAEEGFAVIKATGISEVKDLQHLNDYQPWVTYFLFDTPSSQFGGTGIPFDWSLLQQYNNEVPVFLSGGLSLDNIKEVHKIKDLNLTAIDVNSRFETQPGWKDLTMLTRLKNQIEEL